MTDGHDAPWLTFEFPPGLAAMVDDGVRVAIDMAEDFGQMLRHRIGVAPRHDDCRRFAELRTDCTEDVGRPCALVVGC